MQRFLDHFNNITAFNPSRPKIIKLIFRSLGRTAKKLKLLILCEEVIAVNAEKRKKTMIKAISVIDF
jgi:hypothetical protein